MDLLTMTNRKDLPDLHETGADAGTALAVVRFYRPDGDVSFYAAEFDGQELFFGLIVRGGANRGDEPSEELGHWTLSFLHNSDGLYGRRIDRDIHWRPRPLNEICPDLFSTAENVGRTPTKLLDDPGDEASDGAVKCDVCGETFDPHSPDETRCYSCEMAESDPDASALFGPGRGDDARQLVGAAGHGRGTR